MEIVDQKLEQAEAQLAYWREQVAVAGRQAAMWEGAVEALRQVKAALEAEADAEE